MISENNRKYLLRIIIAASIFSTLFHNLDNYLRFDLYPQPIWITPGGVIRSWIIWTIFGFVGYWFYKNHRFWPSYICLMIYSSCGLSSLVHYLYGGMNEFSPLMHFFILSDGLTGLAVLVFTIWSILFPQKQPLNLHDGV